MMGRLWGLQRAAARTRAASLLERFDLSAAGGRRVATYSGGMRRRLDLAASLVGEPAVLFLDEPTTGLDPLSRQVTWDVVGELTDVGVTVFLTTQNLEEADRLADEVAVIDAGRVVARGTPAELKERVGSERIELTFVDRASQVAALELLGCRAAACDGERCLIEVEGDGTAAFVRRLLDEIDPDQQRVVHFELRRPSLDDVFLVFTGAHREADRAPADQAQDRS